MVDLMFDRLKKRLSEAIKSFAKEEENKAERQTKEITAVAANAQESVSEQVDLNREEPGIPTKKEKSEPSGLEGEIKISIGTKLKGAILKKVMLSEKEIEDFVENIRILLLESDVSFEASDSICESIRNKLSDEAVESKDIRERLVQILRDSLQDVLNRGEGGVNLVETIKARKAEGKTPVKLLFLGPNGTGKTTTMAKVAKMLLSEGITAVFSASDTFRAAAIEQNEYHANKVGVPIVKSSYGADPASVAFDAIKYAEAHSIDAVLIDTAGRQETNKNLIREMEKIYRVAKPDISIYVAESTSGNAIIRQIEEFSKSIKIDGIILTKLDCDVKGGNAISIAKSAGIPILFLGTGESYSDIVPYSSKFIIDRILPSA
ncbi:MAG: signal recognition particle-docking protein FtsY [Candidatus Micrarchaeaceae archaeon]